MSQALEPPGGQRPGEVVRAARIRRGLTLADLGTLTGYSAAQVSRYERGLTPLTDIEVLRGFARALAIPPGELGLAAVPRRVEVRRGEVTAVSGVPSSAVALRVAGEPGGRDDDVRRRQLLAALAAAAAGAVGSRVPAAAPPGVPADTRADVLVDDPGGEQLRERAAGDVREPHWRRASAEAGEQQVQVGAFRGGSVDALAGGRKVMEASGKQGVR